jgi:hypothetical protein
MRMTYQTNLQRSGFRELNSQELDAVSGGFVGALPAGAASAAFVGMPGITVTGSTIAGGNPFADTNTGNGAGGISSGLSSFQMMDLSALAGLAGLAEVDWEEFWEKASVEVQKEIERQEAAMQEQQDLDGDGLPGITVSADRPLPDAIGEMSLSQLITFLITGAATDNRDAADLAAGTNVYGNNPNDIRNAERQGEIYGDMVGAGIEEMLSAIP